MASIRAYSIPPPRMQFLWPPLGVSSLCSMFQACNLNNEEEITVLVQRHGLENPCLRKPRKQDAPAKMGFLFNILLCGRNIIVSLHFRVSEDQVEIYFDLLKQSLGIGFRIPILAC